MPRVAAQAALEGGQLVRWRAADDAALGCLGLQLLLQALQGRLLELSTPHASAKRSAHATLRDARLCCALLSRCAPPRAPALRGAQQRPHPAHYAQTD